MFAKGARAAIALLLAVCSGVSAQSPAKLSSVGPQACAETRSSCADFDAVVFVHGIYGDDETFRNQTTGFDWPSAFPRVIKDRSIDVYRLNYQSALLSWSGQKNPEFDSVATAIFAAMAPLRKRNYRSIGFIAHSLGGNLVSTYIHDVKSGRGHPERAQNAYYITLATPVLGADIASIASPLKQMLAIDDDLLKSLTTQNLYLRMLKHFRDAEGPKGERLGCRAVHLHAAYEQSRVGPLTVVGVDSAALSIANMVASPIIGFPLDHFAIAKPRSASDPVFVWVNDRVVSEFGRLEEWDVARASVPARFRLCERAEYLGEP